MDLTEFTIETLECHVCNTPYRKFVAGKKHVFATCEKCERRDEVGLVF